MKTKIIIEVDIALSDFKNLGRVLMDACHYIKQGEQFREATFEVGHYVYHIEVPVRDNARIMQANGKVMYLHKSKMK